MAVERSKIPFFGARKIAERLQDDLEAVARERDEAVPTCMQLGQ